MASCATLESANEDWMLTERNVLYQLKQGDFSSSKSEELGVFLNISESKIQTFTVDSKSSDRLLIRIINYWFLDDRNLSWKYLATALDCVSYCALAKKFEEKGINERPQLKKPESSENLEYKKETAGLKEEINMLDDEFTILVQKVVKYISDIKIDPEELKNVFEFPPVRLKAYITPLWDEISRKVESEQNVREILKCLHLHFWNFLDYDIMKYFIDNYGTNELKCLMDTYISKIQLFKKNTNVLEFSKSWKGNEIYNPSGYLKFETKHEIEDMNLMELDNFRSKLVTTIQKKLPLSHLSVLLYRSNINEGCILVAWHLLETLSSDMEENIARVQEILQEYHVLWVKLEGKVLYHQEKTGNYKTQPESDEDSIKIILCGETGAGKSTLSNTLLGRHEFDSKRSREPVTNTVQISDFCWTFCGKQFRISVCDTPGCLDNTKPKEKYCEDIMPHLISSHVLLFCIEKDNVQELKGIIEMIMHKIDNAKYPRIIIVLTQADKFVKDKYLDESQAEINYHQELQSRVSHLEATLRETLGNTEVPVIVSSKAGNEIPGYSSESSWLVRMFYEILNYADKRALFNSLARCHPYLLKEGPIKFEDLRSKSNIITMLNQQSLYSKSPKGINSQRGNFNKHVAGAAAGGATAGILGAGVGATIGALAIGLPTFGVAAGAGLVIGGAIGGGIGVAVGSGGAALSSKLKEEKKK